MLVALTVQTVAMEYEKIYNRVEDTVKRHDKKNMYMCGVGQSGGTHSECVVYYK